MRFHQARQLGLEGRLIDGMLSLSEYIKVVLGARPVQVEADRLRVCSPLYYIAETRDPCPNLGTGVHTRSGR